MTSFMASMIQNLQGSAEPTTISLHNAKANHYTIISIRNKEAVI